MIRSLPFISLLFTTLAAWSQEPSLPPKDRFHLFLLAGQSNMAGRGTVEKQDKTPHPRVVLAQWI
ncbi:MAG: hypothetical protein J0M04_10150 [Verrucomicrobia bacterium]|nr:hypothetical protein [Verrucomicrobiota bacterium]